ncbi:prohead protease/major capsid protein fusion protein [Desulfatitalea tepidiphila]|uniref:prohead protease/major capsid protein fusion protein n=1 Tax=Desulfatitalea tepidiphila TaxID=1185843 RepID=UPI0006B63418|nr:prohead protease/major capsid protein fusion protein [Desulfatitalea tepidiphila]
MTPSLFSPLTMRTPPQPRDMAYRTMSLRLSGDGTPASLDAESRSFEVVGATEAPVEVFDYDRYEVVPEILLMDGCEMPGNRQVPLLDTHNRWDTASVLGSYRQMSVDKGQLVGRVFFSHTAEAESPFTKAREGHLTDFSVGYRVIESQWVDKGQKATIRGRVFEGPVRVTTRWRVKELSICPIGADEAAKARSKQPPNSPNHKEQKTMDPRLRAYLESRGLAKDADEAAAWAFFDQLRTDDAAAAQARAAQPPPADPGADPDVDVDQLRRQAVGAERERIVSIDAICQRAGCEELARSFIAEGTPVDQVREEVIERVLSSIENGGGYGHRTPVELGADSRDKFRSAAGHAMLLRGGVIISEPAPGTDELRGYSLRELARHCLRNAGVSDRGHAMEMVGRALTTSDLPFILANVANKSLFDGWEGADETWRIWCDVGSVSDFKTHHSPRLSEGDDLDQIPDKGKYKYGERTETQETYSIATYGKIEAITRHTIINDDLDALVVIPRSHGEMAARKVGDLPYAVLTGNAAMGDGVALFDAAKHFNQASAAGAPAMETMAECDRKMGTQKDLRGKRRLNIKPRYIIQPMALKGTSEVFFQSERYADSVAEATDSSLAATRRNIYSGDTFQRVYDGRLDDDSETAWYAAAEKGRRRTVTVFFLDGVQQPYMEMQAGWTVDGVEYKVRIDAGAKAMDWRGLFRNNGA